MSTSNINPDKQRKLGMTFADFLDKHFYKLLLLFFVVGIFLYIILKSGANVKFGDVTITPTDGSQSEKKGDYRKINDDSLYRVTQKINILKSQKAELEKRLPVMRKDEREITNNNINLLEIEIKNLQNLIDAQ